MFKSLFHYFRKRRFLLALILTAIFSLSVYNALRIEPTEDISKMIPVDDELERFNFANKQVKLNDRIIIIISNKSSESEFKLSVMTAFADSLETHLRKNFNDHISEINNKVSENIMSEIYNLFYDYLPIFLEKQDYITIDSLLSSQSLHKTMEANFKNLLSPASLVSKQFIRKDPLSLTAIALKKLNDLRIDDSYQIVDNHIVSKSNEHLMFFIRSNYSNDETGKNKLLIDGIKKTSEELIYKNFKDIHVELFGAPVISVGNAERIKNDIILTVSIALVALFLFLTFFYRRIEVFFIIFLPAAFGAAVSVAIIQLIKGEVSAISLGVGSVLIGISIDYALHIFTHFRSKTKAADIFKDIVTPILVSSLTSASAFFCLLFVSSDALKDLGLFAGSSVISAALFALIALPHFLRKKKDASGKIKLERTIIERFTAYPFHKNKSIVIAVLLISIIALFTFQNAEFESDMDSMNYMSEELKQTEKKLENISHEAGRKMFLIASGKTLDEALIENDKLYQKLKNLKDSNRVKSFVNTHKFLISDSLQKVRLSQWNKYWSESKIDSLNKLLYEEAKPFGFKLNAFDEFFDHLIQPKTVLKDSSIQILKKTFGYELINETDSLTTIVSLLKLNQEDKKYVYKALENNKHIFIVDKKYITDKIVMILKEDFNLLVKISLSVVFIILLLYFGRIELTIVSFTPMLISWIWTLSFMSLFGLKFTIFNIIISTFIFGLGIDYSIFITNGLLQKYRYNTDHLPSYKTSVLLSAITTVTAIGVLIFAQHPAMKSIAVLSVLGIVSVLILTYTIQPILFNFLIYQQGRRRSLPVTLKDLFFGILVFMIFIIGSVLSGLFQILLKIIPIQKNLKKRIFHYWIAFTSKAIAYIPLNVKKTIFKPNNENFEKPAVIIANHEAHIDIPLLLMLHPKILVLTNDWVQKNIFYGQIVKFADFYPTSNGFEKNLKLLKEKVKKGYSVLIFPEGSRSDDKNIKRFHKGAFSYAKALEIDILPIIIQGAGDCVPKGEPFLKSGSISVHILKRITIPKNESERELAKRVRKMMNETYTEIREKLETPDYFRKKLISNYIYKTPVLEHYTRIKTKSENNYSLFHDTIPKEGLIIDIGCGYGYLSYMLSFCSSERKIIGIDYDCEKINTAQNSISKNDRLEFICENIKEYQLPESDTFIMNDVLHYMTKEDQIELIQRCMNKLKMNGKIIIRDGNPELGKKHLGTKLSEFFSIKLLKFNKSSESQLYFPKSTEIQEIANQNGFQLSMLDNTKYTSNIVYILKKS
jgi:1-acyl-sn-glycerol-3-phosphate acyltransferase